jgi:hypothetical protein
MSILLSPFFVGGHFYAKISGAKQDGYSLPYQNAMSIGVLFYLFIGLVFLRRLLRMFASETAVALTLLAVVLGTNMLWYASAEGLMPHVISFSLMSISLYAFISWMKESKNKHFYLFISMFALCVLIRPLSITILIFFLIYFLRERGFKGLQQLFTEWWKMLLFAFVLFLLIVSPQLLYWHYISGKWIFDVYLDEHFVFSSPQMLPFLFSFRKGLFIYFPVLIFFIAGLIFIYRIYKSLFWSLLVLFLFTVFLLSSWWAWSYGISWGLRPMIDYYCFLALPIAILFDFLFHRRRWKIFVFVTVILCIALNLFQTWQYSKGLIHYDDMSREAYFKGFLQTEKREGWEDLLQPYDWERRMKGLPQLHYSKRFFEGISEQTAIKLRASNGMYLAVNPRAQNIIAAYEKIPGTNAEFYIQRFPSGDKVALRSSNGELAAMTMREAIIATIGPIAHTEELFLVEHLDEDDNRIAIKAANGKYLSADTNFPHVLHADADQVGATETFRYFVVDK